MNRQHATRILYRIYRMLRNGDVKVKLNRKLPFDRNGRKWFGMVDPADNGKFHIHVNPWRPWTTQGGFVSTVLHECLHLVFWDTAEHEIVKVEQEVFNALSDRQLSNLINRVFRHV
jgi:hypothetical protein